MSNSLWNIMDTEARVEALRKVPHLSSGKAGMRFGVSRNVIIGYRSRYDIPHNGKRSASKPKQTTKPKSAPKPRKSRAAASTIDKSKHAANVKRGQRRRAKDAKRAFDKALKQPTNKPVKFAETLSHHCRWPVGNIAPGPDMEVCGARQEEKSSYCPFHAQKVFNTTNELETN